MIGSTDVGEFDPTDELEYSDESEGVVYSSNSVLAAPLSHALDPGASHLIFLPLNAGLEKWQLGAPKDVVRTLFHEWRLPKAAGIPFLLKPKPLGLYTALSAPPFQHVHCSWYCVPKTHISGEANRSLLHVWQTLDTASSRLRVLVCFADSEKVHMAPLLLSLFMACVACSDLSWHRFPAAIIRAALMAL